MRLSEDLQHQLRDAAKRNGTSEAEFIREAIAEKLGRAEQRELDNLRTRIERLERLAGIGD